MVSVCIRSAWRGCWNLPPGTRITRLNGALFSHCEFNYSQSNIIDRNEMRLFCLIHFLSTLLESNKLHKCILLSACPPFPFFFFIHNFRWWTNFCILFISRLRNTLIVFLNFIDKITNTLELVCFFVSLIHSLWIQFFLFIIIT